MTGKMVQFGNVQQCLLTQSIVTKCSGCLNKFTTVKDILLLIPSIILSLTLNILMQSFLPLSEVVLEVLYPVVSCAVLTALTS